MIFKVKFNEAAYFQNKTHIIDLFFLNKKILIIIQILTYKPEMIHKTPYLIENKKNCKN